MDAKVKPEKKFPKKLSFGQKLIQYLYSCISGSFAKAFFFKTSSNEKSYINEIFQNIELF